MPDHANAQSVVANDTLAGSLCCLLLISALLLGGGTRNFLLSDLFVQLLASVILIYALARLRWMDLQPAARQLLTFMALVLAIPLLHLMPLPSALLILFPGRAELVAAREALGVATPAFTTWSLDPSATLASVRALIPAVALAVLAAQIGAVWRSRFLAIFIAAALLMVALGFAQVAQGAESALRFYRPTNVADAVGFFANRNHYGSMLVVALICVFGGVIFHSSVAHLRSQRVLQMLGWLLIGAILLLGIFFSRSRAAIGLAGLMSALMLVFALANRTQRRNAFRWLPIIVLVAGLLAVQFGLNRVAHRFESFDRDLDGRTEVIPGVISLTQRFGGLGTGVGSFPAIYEAYESPEYLGPSIVNHAHNDWAEIWIDAGFLALALVLLLARWFWQRVFELRRDWASGRPENAARLAGALIILSLSLHSLVDYPLRTTALSCVFVAACILMLRASPTSRESAEIASAPDYSI